MGAEVSSQAFVIHDGERVLYADPVVRTLVGADARTDLVKTDVADLVTDEHATQFQNQLERVRDDDTSALGVTVALRTPTETSQDAIAVTSTVEWDDTERLQTSFLTLTGRPHVPETTLRNRAMQSAPIGITIADPSLQDDPIVYCNDGFTEITGYEREEVLGRNCRFLQGEKTRQEPVDRMRAAIDAEEPVTVELRNYRKDGELFWNRVSIVPVTGPEGELSHFVGFQEDISDAKMYAREKTLFERQAEASEQAMYITDSEGRIQTVNPAFERMTGYSATEAIGRSPRILNSGAQDDEFYDDLWETITAGDVWEAQLTNETKDGERFEVDQTIVPIEDDRGEITHFAAIERDITEDVVRKQTVNVLNRLLRHNLRTGINVIEGYTDLLAESDDPDDLETAIPAIREQTRSLKKLAERTETIRTLGDRNGDPRVWDEAHLRGLVEGYRVEYPDAEIELVVGLDEGVTIPDAELVEMALQEAVENAVVHHDRETPTIEVEVPELRGDGQFRVLVRDDGPGVPLDERRVIEAGIETPLTHGSGIGLWIMEWVTNSLGGAFEIGDNDPRGATLEFSLPVGE